MSEKGMHDLMHNESAVTLKTSKMMMLDQGSRQRLLVHYYINKDSLYMAYLPRPEDPDRFKWDGQYRTKEDFELTYSSYEKKRIMEDL